ncbi:MAG: type II secretion system F family protein [Bilophila wadsworthia]
MALAMNTALSDYWYLLLAAAVGMFFSALVDTDKPGPLPVGPTLLTLPLVGRSSRCRSWPLCRHLSILQRSGVSILDSLDILSETINNAALEREFSTIKEKLRSGQGIAEPLSTARYFTPLTINMVAVGEGAGNLETMLEDLAAHYDEEVEYAVGEMTEAIGPILIVVLAAVVGFFALAIFMPMWDMTKLASGGR